MKNIGFIGLGHMGLPMVQNLLKNNCQVNVFDLNKDAVKSCVDEGASEAVSLKEICEEADAVITMLQTGEQVQSCCEEIFLNLNKEAFFIDCSSIDIESSKTLHQKAKEHNIKMCDAPVSGGVAAAEKGMLTFMLGGDEVYFNAVESLLNMMGKKIIYAGVGGSGAAAKICNNMILGISMIAVSEAFNLADQLGLSGDKLFEIVNAASGQCWSLSSYCPYPNILKDAPSSNHYQPGFASQMMLKDLNLSQQAAKFSKTNTPLARHAQLLYQSYVDQGGADTDFSSIIKALRELDIK